MSKPHKTYTPKRMGDVAATRALCTPQKSPSLRTLRRQFLAAQKVEPVSDQPLSPEELENARNLIHEAHKSNILLVDAGAELQAARAAVQQAKANLTEARNTNSRIHAELAPLLKRLPTV